MPSATPKKSKPSQNEALEIQQTEHKGRCFVAARDIRAGECVLRASAYSLIPDSEHRMTRCACCLRPIPPPKDDYEEQQMGGIGCDVCLQVRYCRSECQQLDLPIHRLECEFLAEFYAIGSQKQRKEAHRSSNGKSVWGLANRFDEYTLDYTWCLMRSLIRRHYERHSTEKSPTWSDGLKFEDVWALCSNTSDFDQERINVFTRVASVLLEFSWRISPDSTDTLDDMLQLVCKEECNSFGLYTTTANNGPREGYGLAVFPMAVFFNHSCAPNIVHTTENLEQCFYAARDISAGEEVCITYISIRQDTQSRKEELKRVFLFDCACDRCSLGADGDDWSSLPTLCHQPGCFGVHLPASEMKTVSTKWQCEACLNMVTI